MSGHSLLGVAAVFGSMAAHIQHIEEEMLSEACEVICTQAKNVIGTYSYPWKPLAPATQADRVRQGYPADEPLLRSGELRDSIEWVVHSRHGYVGSNNQKAVWQFLGTRTIPARDPVLDATLDKMPQIAHHMGRRFHAWLAGGGRTSTAKSIEMANHKQVY